MSIDRLEGEVAELLQPLLGAVQQPVRVREQRAVLEPEVDVLPLGSDPGEVPDPLALGQGVGDPAPAGADRLAVPATVRKISDRSAMPVSRIASG